ncbi:MAG: HNH endonuclease [Pseudomonadota bacterium]
MAKVVLVQSSSSVYDDEAGDRYHFPNRYLKRLEKCVDDWAVFFSPVKDTGVSKEARGAYFATAQLGSISKDPANPELNYISVLSGTYADFAQPVPRKSKGSFLETAMQGQGGNPNVGVALQAVRHISERTFERIISLAWQDVEKELPRYDSDAPADPKRGMREASTPFEFEVDRRVVAQLLNRKIRDPRFRGAVLLAYEKRCAVTGWSFTNGGGRAEVEAAHIRPVEHGGPDKISNGLALSGTVHWMFDRGLIAVAANDDILVSRKVNDPSSVRRLINPAGKIVRPQKKEHQPHPEFLRWHRIHHGFAA